MWNNSKRKIIIVIAILIPLGAIFYAVRVPVALALMERFLTSRFEAGPTYKELPDGLHLGLCGAGSPMPDNKRSGPCVAIVAGSDYFVFDAGTKGARNLGQMGWGAGTIQAVFLTHFHSDHIDGLGELSTLRWVGADHNAPLPVYGPKGVKEIVAGLNRAYKLDDSYRTAHHGDEIAPPKASGMVAKNFNLPALGKKVLVLEKGDTKIYAFRVEHDPISPAVGYRIEYKGRVITLSGDTKKSASVEKFAHGADILVHEALSPKLVTMMKGAATKANNKRLAKIFHDILDYHTSPVEAAEIALAANVRHLLLYHIVPPLPFEPLEQVFLEGVSDVWQGGLTLGRDGLVISLPAASPASSEKEIIIKDLF